MPVSAWDPGEVVLIKKNLLRHHMSSELNSSKGYIVGVPSSVTTDVGPVLTLHFPTVPRGENSVIEGPYPPLIVSL